MRVTHHDGPSGCLRRHCGHQSVGIGGQSEHSQSPGDHEAVAAVVSGPRGTVEPQTDVEGEGRGDCKSAR